MLFGAIWFWPNIYLLIVYCASPTRILANLELRSEKPSMTWCSFWTPTKTSPTRQKREHRRARKTYKSLLRGRCSSRNVTPCREERRLFFSSCVGNIFLPAVLGRMMFVWLCLCRYISCVVGVWEGYKGKYTHELTECGSVQWRLKELLWHSVANKIGRRESFDRYLSTVHFANIKYTTLFMPLILCLFLFIWKMSKSGGLFRWV